MTRYEFLLFLHIGDLGRRRRDDAVLRLRTLVAGSAERLATFAGDLEWIGSRVLTTSSAAVFLSGVALVWDAPYWGFGDDWILIGFGLFAVTFLAGSLFFGPGLDGSGS